MQAIYTRPQDLSLFLARVCDHGAEPCLGVRHHPHPDGERLSVSGGDRRGASRAVLSWRLSNTIDTRFCAEAREEALQRHGEPRISAQCDPLRDNADQGAQFASAVFTGKLEAASIAISADERGRFLDIISIERLRRSIEYEEVRLKACGDGREARAGVGYWMNLYTHRRPHPASNASTNRPKLWIRRFAWITQTPCPHSHSSDRRNSSNRLEGFFKEEPKGKRRRDSHLKSTGPWSQQDGPPHPNNRRDTV